VAQLLSLGVMGAFMTKRVSLILFWAVVFPLIYLVLSMLVFGVIGMLKIFPEIPPDVTQATMTPAMRRVAILGMIWAWVFWLSPIVGLILGIRGVLPGTRRQKMEDRSHAA